MFLLNFFLKISQGIDCLLGLPLSMTPCDMTVDNVKSATNLVFACTHVPRQRQIAVKSMSGSVTSKYCRCHICHVNHVD